MQQRLCPQFSLLQSKAGMMRRKNTSMITSITKAKNKEHKHH